MLWLLLFLLLYPAPVLPVSEDSWIGPAHVVDGDTLRIDGTRLRLLDIDAFESTQTCSLDGREYSCGSRAAEALQGLIGSQTVRCYGRERDRYGRPLVNCYAGSLDLSDAMVRSGWAVAEYSTVYRIEEALAREARTGAWAGTFDRPKNWRKRDQQKY